MTPGEVLDTRPSTIHPATTTIVSPVFIILFKVFVLFCKVFIIFFILLLTSSLQCPRASDPPRTRGPDDHGVARLCACAAAAPAAGVTRGHGGVCTWRAPPSWRSARLYIATTCLQADRYLCLHTQFQLLNHEFGNFGVWNVSHIHFMD